MPRNRQTQTPKAPGMEAGAGYGEQSENIAAQDPAQGGIALPGGGFQTSQTPDGTVAAARPTKQSAAPLDAAQQWIPDVMPLTAPDDRPDLGLLAGSPRRIEQPASTITTKSSPRATRLIRRLAQTTGNPRLSGLLRSAGRG